MEFTAVPAVQFSGAQLTTILNDCFADYLVPVSMSVDLFVQRFSAEGLNLLQSKVWLAGDEPAAIGLIARRGRDARLAALLFIPAFAAKDEGDN